MLPRYMHELQSDIFFVLLINLNTTQYSSSSWFHIPWHTLQWYMKRPVQPKYHRFESHQNLLSTYFLICLLRPMMSVAGSNPARTFLIHVYLSFLLQPPCHLRKTKQPSNSWMLIHSCECFYICRVFKTRHRVHAMSSVSDHLGLKWIAT